MKKILFIFFSIVIFKSSIFAQFIPCDTAFTVPYSPFLKTIHDFKDFKRTVKLANTHRILPLYNCSLYYNGEEIIKIKDQIYILLAQTGFIYKMSEPVDSMVRFTKIDKTYNLNYNIDCYNFTYEGNLYNYGGYGFWQKTGHIRRYNEIDKEWDIVPTNIEVIPSGYEWYSPNEGIMYLPFQKIEKRFLKDPIFKDGLFDYRSYKLDIKTGNWQQLGRLSKSFEALTNQKNNYLCLRVDSGNLFLINDETYFFDYLNNKVYKSKQADLNQYLLRNSNNNPIFYYKGWIYKYNKEEGNFKTWQFNIQDFTVLDFPIWTSDFTQYYFIFGIILFVSFIVVVFFLIKRKIKQRLQNAQLKILKTTSIQQAFSGVEVNLIELLLDEYKKGNKVEIHQMNRVLGIKDKNIGLQKKVRSDVINSINDKYQFITQTDILLISSVRKLDDKRFFEYYITETEINNIQKIVFTK